MENEIFLVRYYWSLLLRHPLRWLVPMLLIAAVGSFIVIQSSRSYMSTARVSVQSPQPTTDSLVQSTVTSERIQYFEQRVFSRENLVGLAHKLNLFGELRSNWTDSELAERVRRQISLQVIPTDPTNLASTSAVVTINFEAGTAELAAAGANEVVQLLILENRNARMSEATQLRTFLEQEVTNRREQAAQLDAEWNSFVSTNEALLPSRLAIYSSEMQELQQELQTIQTASATLSADTRVLETQLALANRPAAGEEDQLAALRVELASKQTLFSDTHPDIVSLRSRIAALESSLANVGTSPEAEQVEPVTAQTAEGAMLAERVSSAQQQQAEYAARREQINERLGWLRQTIAAMPGVEADLLALQRRHTAADDNLADMQGRLDTALVGERLETAQKDSQISVIDQPEVPTYPTGSGRTRGFIVVGVLAVGFGLACLILLDVRDRTIKSKRDLRPILEGAALVIIPDWKPEGRKPPRTRLASVMSLLVLGSLAGAAQNDMPQDVATEPTQNASQHS